MIPSQPAGEPATRQSVPISSALDGVTREPIAARLDAVGMALLVFPVGIVVFATMGFGLGFRLHPIVMLPAALVAAAAIRVLSRTLQEAVVTGLVAVLLHGAAYAVASLSFDPSYDGLWYHQEAILRLAAGWNPISEDPALYGGRPPNSGLRWVLAYPKAGWIMAAPLFQMFGRIEPSKLFTLTLMGAVACHSGAALIRLTTIRVSAALLLALLIAANPVAIYQSVTFYVDGLLACGVTLLAGALFQYVVTRDRRTLVVAAASGCLLINLKFTGAVYAALFLLAACVGMLRRHGSWSAVRFGTAGAAAYLVSMVVIGYAPYAANLVKHHSPFYPVATVAGVNQRIVSNNWPPNIVPLNRVSRFLAVNFAYANGDYPPPETTGKLPGAVDRSELGAWWKGDTRIGGLGPLYGALLLLGAVVLLSWLALSPRDTLARACVGAVVVLVASVFIHSEGWWARYAPQAWLIPLAVVVMAVGSSRPSIRAMAGGLAVVALLNIVLLTGGVVRSQSQFRAATRASLAAMAAEAPVQVYLFRFLPLRQRLAEAGIPFQIEKDPPAASIERHLIPSADSVAAFWWK